MMRGLFFISLFILIITSQSVLSPYLDSYQYSHVFGTDHVLFWSPVSTTGVRFGLAIKATDVWTSLGISDSTNPLNSMDGSFAVMSSDVGYVEKIISPSQAYSSFPTQSGAVKAGTFSRTVNGSYIIVEFERDLDTGNAQHKVLSLTGSTMLLGAYGSSQTYAFHAGRFAFALTLGDGSGSTPLSICEIGVNCDATGGTCVDGQCKCNSGYQGTTCDTKVDVNGGDTSGYKFNSTFLDGKFVLYWNLPEDHTAPGAIVDMAIRGKTDGWVGIGISRDGEMVGSEAVMGWVTSEGVAHVKAYSLGGKSVSALTELDTIQLTDISAFNQDGETVIKFKRAIDSGKHKISTDGNTFIVAALGSTKSLSSHSSSERLGTSVDFISGSIGPAVVSPLKVTHGIMMIIAWGVLLPTGVFLARYRPKIGSCIWWPAHPALQASGYLLSVVAFILAIVMVELHLNSPHAVFGYVMTIFGFINFIFAFFRPHQPEGYDKANPNHKQPSCGEGICCKSSTEYTGTRWFWENKHRYLGRILIVVGFFTIILGLIVIGASVALIILWIVWIVLVCVVFVIFEFRKD